MWVQVLLACHLLLAPFIVWLGYRIRRDAVVASSSSSSTEASLGASPTEGRARLVSWEAREEREKEGAQKSVSRTEEDAERNSMQVTADLGCLWETPKRRRNAEEVEDLARRRRLTRLGGADKKAKKTREAETLPGGGVEEEEEKARKEEEEIRQGEEEELIDSDWEFPSAPPPLWILLRDFCLRFFAIYLITVVMVSTQVRERFPRRQRKTRSVFFLFLSRCV